MGSLYRRKQKLKDGTFRELPTIWIKYYQNGRAVRESTGTTKETVARRMLRRREGDVEHGIPIVPKMGRITWEDAAKSLLADYTRNEKKTHDDVERRLTKHLTPYFRGRRLISITPNDVLGFIATRQAANRLVRKARTIRRKRGTTEIAEIRRAPSNGEINRELAALKRLFRLAVKAGEIHHIPDIPMLRETNVRAGFFEPEQFNGVCAHLPEALRPVAKFGFLTGWRLTEITGLEWRQVDMKGREVRLDPGTTKNREGRTFPFTAALEHLFKEQQAERDRLKKEDKVVSRVFHREGEPIGRFDKAWKSACRAALCPGRLFHDLRRTAVRNLVRAGVPERVAMTMTGHKTRSVFERYNIVSGGDLRHAAAKLDAIAMGTIPGTTSSGEQKSAVGETA